MWLLAFPLTERAKLELVPPLLLCLLVLVLLCMKIVVSLENLWVLGELAALLQRSGLDPKLVQIGGLPHQLF